MLPKALLNAAVFLYAVLGFSLSVLTSLCRLLRPKPPTVPLSKPHLQPLVPRSRPIPRSTQRSFSDKPSAPPAPKSAQPDTQSRRKLLAGHRRSRSIPLITLDYFGSTENLHLEPRSPFGPLPPRKPLTFVIPPPPGREPPWSDTEKPAFKLTNLFSKEKKRKAGESKLPPSPTLPRNVPRPPVRRVASAPVEHRLTMRCDLISRTVEKKKSATLRTLPYEAPFFCPPPVRPIRPKSRSTLDLRSKALHKPSRTSTLKT